MRRRRGIKNKYIIWKKSPSTLILFLSLDIRAFFSPNIPFEIYTIYLSLFRQTSYKSSTTCSNFSIPCRLGLSSWMKLWLRRFCICSPFLIGNFLKRISLISTGFRPAKRGPWTGPQNLEGTTRSSSSCALFHGEKSLWPKETCLLRTCTLSVIPCSSCPGPQSTCFKSSTPALRSCRVIFPKFILSRANYNTNMHTWGQRVAKGWQGMGWGRLEVCRLWCPHTCVQICHR